MTDRFGLLYDDRFARDLASRPDAVDFLEIIPDRYFALDDLGALPDLPTVFHSLDLSIGSDEPLDPAYLDAVVRLARHCKPLWASDHLAVSKIDGPAWASSRRCAVGRRRSSGWPASLSRCRSAWACHS